MYVACTARISAATLLSAGKRSGLGWLKKKNIRPVHWLKGTNAFLVVRNSCGFVAGLKLQVFRLVGNNVFFIILKIPVLLLVENSSVYFG